MASETTEVQVARIDERTQWLAGKLSDHIKQEDSWQTSVDTKLDDILSRIDDQSKSVQQYKIDRTWFIGIFTVLYGILIAWIKGTKLGGGT